MIKIYSDLLKQKMLKKDYNAYKNVIESNNHEELYRMHADYFEHDYIEPCDCNGSVKKDAIRQWVGDLNRLYSNTINN